MAYICQSKLWSFWYLIFLCSFHDAFRNTDPSALESEELASDGIIMDLTYSPERYANYFCWTFPWKIFPNKTLHVTLLQKWVRLCVLWQAGVHQAIFWSWCWDDVVSGPTRPRGRSYSGETSYPGPYLGPNLSVARTMARTRRHLEIFLIVTLRNVAWRRK